MLDQAFETLKTYDWGADPKSLSPIDEAIIETHGNAAGRRDLEDRLLAVLAAEPTRDGVDYICRKLMQIGSSACVPALTELLPQKEHSHMARYALERIPAPEAAGALRDAVSKVNGQLKVGVLSSIGARQDGESVAMLGKLLNGDDAAVAHAAAHALGAIRSADAADALASAEPKDGHAKQATADASFACAESLLAAGDKATALKIYKSFAGTDQPKHVRLAATRGMLACAGA